MVYDIYVVYGIRYMVYGIWFAVCDMRYAVSREASAIVDGNLYHFFNVLKKCMEQCCNHLLRERNSLSTLYLLAFLRNFGNL